MKAAQSNRAVLVLRPLPSLGRRTYSNLLEPRILSPLNVSSRELPVFVHFDDIPLSGLVIVRIDDVLLVPPNSMNWTGNTDGLGVDQQVQVIG